MSVPRIIDTTAEVVALSEPRPLPPSSIVAVQRTAPDFEALGRGVALLAIACILGDIIRRTR